MPFEVPAIALNWIPPTLAVVVPIFAQPETATNNSGALVPPIAGDNMVVTGTVVSSVAPLSCGATFARPCTSKRQAAVKLLPAEVLIVIAEPLVPPTIFDANQTSVVPPTVSLP